MNAGKPQVTIWGQVIGERFSWYLLFEKKVLAVQGKTNTQKEYRCLLLTGYRLKASMTNVARGKNHFYKIPISLLL